GCDSNLHVLNLANGKELASVDLGGQTGSSAAIEGDHLYVGTMSNQVLAIDWKKAAVEWRFEAPERQQPFFASAAVTADLVFAGSRDKRLYALDRKAGKEVWSFPTGGRVESSPVVVGDRVFASSLDGNLYVLDAKTSRQLRKFKLDAAITG